MNGRGGSSAGGGSLNDFNFDFGIGSDKSRSLNDRKQHTFSSSSQSQPSNGWQPNKPSWTHQPASSHLNQGGLNGPTSMVGDILGKSWGSSSVSGIGIVEKNPNLFGDLVNSALGKGGGSNVQLKDAIATSGHSNGPYSMGNLSASLPKAGYSAQSGGIRGSSNGVGARPAGPNRDSVGASRVANCMNKNAYLGGPSMRSLGGAASGKVDPFGSLFEFGAKNATVPISGSNATETKSTNDRFGDFQNVSGSMGSSSNASVFSTPTSAYGSEKPHPPSQVSGSDKFDNLFVGSSVVSASSTVDVDEWSGGNEKFASTTELEDLPPPPPGVSASTAKNKGMDHKNQGQYADAIKWLSWAVLLLEKTAERDSTTEALSCRASCYKEVGDYKKAVTDCSKVLEYDDSNVSVLVQRALLYESMEKYKLGADDLRKVLKIDPVNRIAKSTIHRLTQMF